MSALPHLAFRLRRWIGIRLLRSRVQQLQTLIDQVADSIERDHHTLAALRSQLAIQRALLTQADPPRHRHHPPEPNHAADRR